MTTLEDLWVAAYDPGAHRHIEYPTGSMADGFDEFTTTYADRPALDFFGARTSFAELREQVYTVAGNLYQMGIRPGDFIAMLMPTCPQHVIAFYAAQLIGATVVEHNPLYTVRELTPLFSDHHATMAIVWDAAAPSLQELPDDIRPATIISINLIEAMPLSKRLLLKLPIAKARASREQLSRPATGTIDFSALLKPSPQPPASARPKASETALLLYTSGTTGRPKGVPLTHSNLLASTQHALEWVTMMVPGQEVFLTCLPLFHVFGCSLSMNAGLAIGAMLHLIPKPETGLILDAIKRKTPTMAIAVPPLFERIADGAAERGVSIKGIRTGICGAMTLRPEVLEKWESATGGLLIEGYGLSECSPIVAGNPVNTTRSANSIGVPFPDTQVRLVDPDDLPRDVELGEPGEIWVKGPQVFGGYRNLPEGEPDSFYDGWFRTGDVAVADERGYLRIVDRIKEVVITGGFNVYPSEVEEAMRDQDGITDIAVVGLANEFGVEEVVAAVVTADGLIPDMDELRQSLKQRLASYKVPRRIFVVNELPRNEMGKVLRREVRGRVERMDLDERLRRDRGRLREKFADWTPDLAERFAQVGPELRERLENLGPELRERLENLDREIRERLDDLTPHLRAKLDALDLPTRLEMLKTQLMGDDETDQTPKRAADED